eukprot:PhM_4_TR3052/c0_g1_i1/m.97752
MLAMRFSSVSDITNVNVKKVVLFGFAMTALRQVAGKLIAMYVFKTYPEAVQKCQKHAFSSSLVKWSDGWRRLIIPLLDEVTEQTTLWVIHKLGFRPSNALTPSFWHIHFYYEVCCFSLLANYITWVPLGLSTHFRIPFSVIEKLIAQESLKDYYIAQIPALATSAQQMCYGLYYRRYVYPFGAKRTPGDDVLYCLLQVATTAMFQIWLPVPLARAWCRARGTVFGNMKIYSMQVFTVLLGQVVVELGMALLTLLQAQVAEAPPEPEAPEGDGHIEIVRQESIDVTSLPSEDREHLSNLDKEFSRHDSMELDELLGACTRVANDQHTSNSVRLNSIMTSMRAQQYLQAVSAGFLRRGLTPSVIPAILRPAQSSESCTICLGAEFSDDDPSVGLPCKHCFHKSCISEWLQRKKRCPFCRMDLVPHRRNATDAHRQLEMFGQEYEHHLRSTPEGSMQIPELEYAPWHEVQLAAYQQGVELPGPSNSGYDPELTPAGMAVQFGLILANLTPPEFMGE